MVWIFDRYRKSEISHDFVHIEYDRNIFRNRLYLNFEEKGVGFSSNEND